MSPVQPARLVAFFAALVLQQHACAQSAAGNTPRPDTLEVPAAPGAARGGIDFRLPGQATPDVALPASIAVRAFRITGLTSIPAQDIDALLAPWTGRTLTSTELRGAVDGLTTLLRERGLLIAQATLPAQDFGNGLIDITVQEGRLGQLRMESAADLRLRASVLERFGASLRPGDTLRGDNLEQGLLLLNDLPGVRVEAALTPGTQPGSADVQAKVENDGLPLAATVTIDNAGLRATAEYRTDATLRWKSPLHLGDLLTLRLLASHTAGQKLGSITYGLPINAAGTRLGVRYTEQEYRLYREFTPLAAHGQQRAASLLISHPLLRRSNRNLYLSASYNEFTFSDRQDAVAAESTSRQRVLSLGLSGDFRDALGGGGITTLQTLAYAGETRLLTPTQLALDEAPGGLGVAGQYQVLRLRAERVQAIDARSNLQISWRSQFASRNLDPGLELAVGGPNAVRAYPSGEAFADQGHLTRIDYRRSFALLENLPTIVSVFYDHARVEINRNPLPTDVANKRSFAGYGFGLAQAFGSYLTLQSYLAWRSTAQPAGEPDRRPRVWVTLAASI